MPQDRPICFVIMPFSTTTSTHTEDYWDAHFKDFLKPLIEVNQQLKADRSRAIRGSIPRGIITSLINSPVVVADLTDRNPNVYWELGIRQSFKHGTVTIVEEGTNLPFDIYGKGTLFYSPTGDAKFADFDIRFKEAIKDCLDNPDRPDSDVLETISGRGSLFEIFRREEALRRLDAVLAECDRNLKVLEWVSKAAEMCKRENGKQKRLDVYHLMVPAIEMLLTSRYLREAPAFYQLATDCWESLVVINNHLAEWRFYPKDVQGLVLKTQEGVTKLLKQLQTQVESAQERVRNQV